MNFDFFGKDFPYQKEIWPKNKMVRMVNMNIFYRMDLQISDSKSEFLTKTENWGFSENWKIQFWDPKLTFEAVFKTEMISKYILGQFWVILTQFPYIKTWFSIKNIENR